MAFKTSHSERPLAREKLYLLIERELTQKSLNIDKIRVSHCFRSFFCDD
jgi:hypothetical protein